jgi:hypothetical protein
MRRAGLRGAKSDLWPGLPGVGTISGSSAMPYMLSLFLWVNQHAPRPAVMPVGAIVTRPAVSIWASYAVERLNRIL